MGETMTDLLSRLQALTEPSREIDAEIFERFGKVNEDHCRSWCAMDGRTNLKRKDFIRAWAPSYSESLHAALTLVPGGWTVGVHSDCNGRWFAEMRQCGVGTHISWPSAGNARAVNGAIALLIAIMKAKEESKR